MSDSNQLRQLLTKRIKKLVDHSVGENADWKYRSTRWDPCQEFLYVNALTGDPTIKKSKKEIPTIDPSDSHIISCLSEQAFAEYFEMVVRRFNTCM